MVVIGVGNTFACDDAAGLALARRVRTRLGRSPGAAIAVHEHEGDTLALLDLWQGARAVLLLDAVSSGAPPGTVHRIDASSQAVPAALRSSSSTHAVGVAEAIELARALRRLPGRVVLYGVEGQRFDAGEGLSGQVADALGPLAERVLAEARSLAG